MSRLSDLNTGEKAVIVKILGHGGFRKRIIEMGFIQGKTVEVVHRAPLQDPVEYEILGYHVSLRLREASQIEVISVEEAEHLAKEHNPKTGNFVPTCIGCKEAGCKFRDSIQQTTEEEDALYRGAREKSKEITVALVGNPNCGKTSLFNRASGSHQRVGNYSGVTVDAVKGKMYYKGYRFTLIDLPGTYSISAYSPEEKYVRHSIVNDKPDVILNVVDSSNLERNLFLTTQLIDMNLRMVIALNMFDELEHRGDTLNYKELEKLLGVPMIPTVSRNGRGIEQLFHIIINIYVGGDFIKADGSINENVLKDIQEWHKENVFAPEHAEHLADFTNEHGFGDKNAKHAYRHIHVNHGADLEQIISHTQHEIGKNENIRSRYSTRFLAIKFLEGDKDIESIIAEMPNSKKLMSIRENAQRQIQDLSYESLDSAITDAKFAFIQGALKETYEPNKVEQRTITDKIDAIATHRFWAFPIFIFILYAMFQCTFTIGQYPMDWIDWCVNQIGQLVNTYMPDGSLKDMIVDGIIGGVGSVIVFLPNILILYLFISLLEDSGYMARAAFIMDKLMHKMGLHGKSFIPLIMGFGCNVPAVMATRTIENRKSRLITMLILPMMSCSARLPIYIVLIGAFFSQYASLIMLSIYVTGIVMSILLARIFSKFVMKGDDSPFVMELPPYRMPTAKSVIRHTWEKGVQYLQKMGGVILVASIIVWFLGYFPRQQEGQTIAEQQENSYIGKLGKSIEPIFEPMGSNWKLDVGLISGIGAKELVVSTLGVLYNIDEEEASEASESISANTSMSHQLAKEITPLAAYAYMLFVLIYFPCIATISAIKGESGKWKWAIFTAVYTTVLAWCVATAFYQIGTFILK